MRKYMTLLIFFLPVLCFAELMPQQGADEPIGHGPITVTWVSPTEQQTIQNQHHITLTVKTSPTPLPPGVTVKAVMDDKTVGVFSNNTVSIPVIRGTHTLQAVVTDSFGHTLSDSATITIYVHQASKLHKHKHKK